MKSSKTVQGLPALWGGVECTVNRVGDLYFDQMARNGHDTRIEDLELFAELGIRAIRYPALWERTAPHGIAQADWRWPDERLKRLRELQIEPIVGLVHHGSGPAHTNLLDSSFATGLAEYAHAVAERYPWVKYYTPVNEPLTTARFSGLYGHWYPHHRSDKSFARALINQCRAVSLSMQAIRRINPEAQLVQTDDLGKIFCTPKLRYQAEFENERRWLTFDLLCGHVDTGHRLWPTLLKWGITEEDLSFFQQNPCPPDILGFNYYLTSERFLDERCELYPDSMQGGNGIHRYVDVEAVRVRIEGTAGLETLLREAWERYQLPMAVTEAHLGCTREEQMRWLQECWDSAVCLRRSGVDVRAITAWSLLGAYNWNSLVTRDDNCYEPGIFDLRGPQPRPTALAEMLKHFARGKRYSHPALDTPGWWHRMDRLLYPAIGEDSASNAHCHITQKGYARPLVITDTQSILGNELAKACERRGLAFCGLQKHDIDVAETTSILRMIADYEPWAIINTADYDDIDLAEREPDRCRREIVAAAGHLAQACKERGIQLVSFSTDLVFDGETQRPYVESDRVHPLSVYGKCKAEAERQILETLPSALIVRTSALFGMGDEQNFLAVALRTMIAKQRLVTAGDTLVSPTHLPDMVHACLDLLMDHETGIWHLTNPGTITWAEFARMAGKLCGLDTSLIDERPGRAIADLAPRPAYSVLSSERGRLLPPLETALAECFRK